MSRTAIRLLPAICLFAVGGLLAACGSSGSTTVIKKQSAPQPQTTTVTSGAAPAPKPKPVQQAAPPPQTTTQAVTAPPSVPDVVGEKLPEAKADLALAGYVAKARNTDTVFGIVIPSHYTVCKQDDPVGRSVGVLAQKYGC